MTNSKSGGTAGTKKTKKLTVKKSTIKDLSVGRKGEKVRGGEPPVAQTVYTYCAATKCATGDCPCP